MNGKLFIWIGLFLGSVIGTYIPSLWGASVFSFSAILASALGSIIGIWIGYKISKNFN